MDAPLRAFVAIPGKSLFARLGDRRVRTYPADWTGEVEPDLVVLPCSQPTKFDASEIRMPESAAGRLRDGRAVLVFDASLEGLAHTDAWAETMRQVMADLGVQPARTLYLTQHRRWRADHLAWCAEHGQAAVHVLEYDYWIGRLFAGAAQNGEAAFEARLARFRRRPAHRSRRFLSLNWTLRSHKALFLLALMRDGLWDQGHISFGGFEQLRVAKDRGLLQFAKRLRRETGFADLVAELLPSLEKLEAVGQVSLGPPESGQDDPNLIGDASLGGYDDSWFSVVTESDMLDHFSRATEKSFKPMLNFHPAILMANPGALAFVRSLGFQTFPALFDEAYDDETDPRRRFDLVYRQLRGLCAADEGELRTAEAALDETLVFNARWGLVRMPEIWRTRTDRDLTDALLALVRPG
ncbi:MAG TPA: hypothetical protein VHX64_14555 [Caulobacteraceae bacterium]|nr:hypothetical protein [Caulobacteraceae bacterium]